jgi:hypothetical protein
MRLHAPLALLPALLLSLRPGIGQEIISAQSGVIHYFEGAVLVDDTPLDHKPGTFPLIKDGSVLKTRKGRVEVMLTPGTFLRLDDNSSVKMLSTALTSTSLEFLTGSAILDALAAPADIPVVLHFKDASVRFLKPGLYRVDSETEVLQAYSGEASVEQQSKQTRVDPTRLYFFELGTDTKKFSDGPDDEFLDWARNRNQIITAENQSAQADDAADADPDLGTAPFFNYNVPYGGLSTSPGFPSIGGIHPYSAFLYSPYTTSPLSILPPLPTPLLLIGRSSTYHRISPAWPSSGTWATHHPASGSWLATHPTTASSWLSSHPIGVGVYPRGTYTRPITTLPRAPLATPHVAAPSVHVGHR